jgi:uncharacterized membrane protein
VNTIVLAYAGTALPLLLIVAVGPQPLAEILYSEYLVEEVARSAVAMIGLAASVSITTALATLVAERCRDQVPAFAGRAGDRCG